MKEITSSKKIAKKARAIYRKEMKREAESMGKMLGNALKPKPRWVPWFVWMWGIRIFIKVK